MSLGNSTVSSRLRSLRDSIVQSSVLNRFARYGVAYDKLLMIGLLTVVTLVQSLGNPAYLVPVAAAVITAVVLESVYNVATTPKYLFPGGAVITALIVSGIVFPGEIVPAVGVTVLAIVLKQVVSREGRNVFNPAALGLLLGAVFFDVGLAWWSAGTLVVVVLGVVIAYLLKIHDVAFSFLVPYWLLTFLVTPSRIPTGVDAVIGLLQSHAVFFALIMVVEPVTSPNRSRSRILYGAGVAVLAVGLQVGSSVIPDVATPLLVDNLLLALLVMNAVHRIVPDRYMA